MPSHRHFFPGGALALFLACVACGSSGPPETTGFGAEPLVTATSTHGTLSVAVRTSPQPPSVGIDEGELTVTDSTTGAPVDGLSLSVVPFMPAMGHGTSLVPTVTPLGHGKYQVENLELFMAGDWELRTSLKGSVTDTVNPVLYVP
jgi:hypothetical protein